MSGASAALAFVGPAIETALVSVPPALADVPTEAIDVVVRVLGFCLVAGTTSATAAAAFRWYGREELPEGMGILIGLSVVALWLNTQSALNSAMLGRTDLFDPTTAVLTVATFVAGGIAADVGRRGGDAVSKKVTAPLSGPRNIDEVTQIVRSAGRVITVELPDAIEDAEGYDPIDESKKAELAGLTLVFPRKLTLEELRDRLIDRLERDYGVGHVEVDVTADGEVTFLALGSRPSGLGPTLAPGTVALAIHADPAPDASPGDVVELWRRNEGGDPPERVAKAELRATAGDVATVAVEAEDAEVLAEERPYRLVTLPGTPDVVRELVALLRAADETVVAVDVAADGPLDGAVVDDLSATVLVVDRGESALAFPDGETLAAGDVVYALGLPEELRRLTSDP